MRVRYFPRLSSCLTPSLSVEDPLNSGGGRGDVRSETCESSLELVEVETPGDQLHVVHQGSLTRTRSTSVGGTTGGRWGRRQ